MAEEKKKINEQEMEALCKDLWPHITGIRELLVKHGVEKTISLSVSADGYVSFDPSDCDWELVQISPEDGPDLRCTTRRKLLA